MKTLMGVLGIFGLLIGSIGILSGFALVASGALLVSGAVFFAAPLVLDRLDAIARKLDRS